jgi:TRAP transporter 4TM/12TM fusion protein
MDNTVETCGTGFSATYTGRIKIVITAVGIAMVAIHMAVSQWLFVSTEAFLTLHLGFALLLVFLSNMAKKERKKSRDVIFSLAIIGTVICVIYIIASIDSLRMNAWFNSTPDLIIGVLLLVLAFYAAVMEYGWFIPGIVLVSILYPFMGRYLPEPFTTFSLPIKKVISNMSIGLKSGLYDSTLTISSNYIFLFCVFGGLIEATGVQQFFSEFGKMTVGRFKSGPALMASINCALVGTIVGSAVANVTITGPYTIPSMKKAGYTPEQAAAIDSVASNGGQILPPVMGIMAFAMAGFSGIPYWQICKMALVPALIYYFILVLYCQLHALKNPVLRNRVIEKMAVDKQIVRIKGAAFIIPLAVIIILFAKGFSCMNVAFWTILTILAVSAVQPREHRPRFKNIMFGFVEGAISGAKIACICAIIGCLVTSFTSSGLAIKLTSGIDLWSHGSLLLALLILWVGVIIAGMVGVSVAAYLTAAAFAVPVLQKLGVPFEIAHFFISYPAAFTLLTPPVALVSLVAAQIANANYKKTAIESCKIAVTAFFLPFLFVYAPSLLLIGDPLTFGFWADILIIFFGAVAMEIAFVGYLGSDLRMIESVCVFVASLFMLIYPIVRIPAFAFGGLIAAVVLLGIHLVRSSAGRSSKERLI